MRFLVVLCYKLLRKRSLQNIFAKLISNLEKGDMYSSTLRFLYKKFHDVDVGLYTYGCFYNFDIRPGVSFGRYCSVAKNVVIIDANHPVSHKSTHPFFYSPDFGIIKESQINHIPTVIGNDVWIGRNALLTPSVRVVGDGAIIAAGAVVTKDIPPYAIVGGNPAKVIRYRFSERQIQELLKEKWWEREIQEIKHRGDEFIVNLEDK